MTGLGSSLVCLGWGFGCAEPEPHLVASSQPCRGSQGCSCCQLWLSPKCRWVWRCPRTSALGGVGSCSHPGAMGRDVPPVQAGAGMHAPICPVSLRQSCQGPWPGLLVKVEPEDTGTRATGAACGVPRSGIPGWAPGGVGRTTGSGILGRAPHLPGSGFRYRRGPGAISEGSAATAAPGAAPGVCADPPPRHRPLHPNPASPALPGAPSPRLPRCPAPPPGRSRCPLSPGALCLRLSRCPAFPQAAFGHPKSPGSSRGRAPGRAQPVPSRPLRLSQTVAAAAPGEFASSLPFSRRSAAPREVPGQELQDGTGQGREQQARVCTSTWGGLSRDLAPPGPRPIGAGSTVLLSPSSRGADPRVIGSRTLVEGGQWGSGSMGAGGDGSSGRWELLARV